MSKMQFLQWRADVGKKQTLWEKSYMNISPINVEIWGPTFLARMLQISPAPSISATVTPFSCLNGCSAFYCLVLLTWSVALLFASFPLCHCAACSLFNLLHAIQMTPVPLVVCMLQFSQPQGRIKEREALLNDDFCSPQLLKVQNSPGKYCLSFTSLKYFL